LFVLLQIINVSNENDYLLVVPQQGGGLVLKGVIELLWLKLDQIRSEDVHHDNIDLPREEVEYLRVCES